MSKGYKALLNNIAVKIFREFFEPLNDFLNSTLKEETRIRMNQPQNRQDHLTSPHWQQGPLRSPSRPSRQAPRCTSQPNCPKLRALLTTNMCTAPRISPSHHQSVGKKSALSLVRWSQNRWTASTFWDAKTECGFRECVPRGCTFRPGQASATTSTGLGAWKVSQL